MIQNNVLQSNNHYYNESVCKYNVVNNGIFYYCYYVPVIYSIIINNIICRGRVLKIYLIIDTLKKKRINVEKIILRH